MLKQPALAATASERQSGAEQGTDANRPNARVLFERYYNKIPPRTKPSSGTASELNLVLPRGVLAGSEKEDETLPENLAERLSDPVPYVVAFRILQEWDGYVLEVGSDSFRARLTDLTNANQADSEEVEISIEDLDDESRSQLEPGRLFRWSIGYERIRSGQKTRISRIVMRRLPAWTQKELTQAREEAATISKILRWD